MYVQITNCSNDITDDNDMNAPMANFKCIKSGNFLTLLIKYENLLSYQ